MFLESNSIMKARQEVYCCFETRRTLRAAKDEDTYLPSCLMTVHHFLFLRPQWLAGFIEKFLRFKTRKWRRQFVFFQRCHRWASGATVVVETALIWLFLVVLFCCFFSANQKPFVICTHVTGELHSSLSQSELSNSLNSCILLIL